MIVSNTTPISNFLHLGQMEILKTIFKELHVPMAVHFEIEAYFSGDYQWQRSLDEGFIIRTEIQTSPKIKELMIHLHMGEAEALCICIENNAKLCLLDDKDARIINRLNNIPISGTLGVLMKAKKMGIIESVKDLMDRLRTDHHYWIDNSMYNKVLSLSNE
jgi:predicted nucleic acid-binding protein